MLTDNQLCGFAIFSLVICLQFDGYYVMQLLDQTFSKCYKVHHRVTRNMC